MMMQAEFVPVVWGVPIRSKTKYELIVEIGTVQNYRPYLLYNTSSHNYDWRYMQETKFIRVTDNWYPCYEKNKIMLTIRIVEHIDGKGDFVKIIASGADDYYLEAEYHSESRTTLELMYLTWAKQIFDEAHDGINQQWFLNRGFVRGI